VQADVERFLARLLTDAQLRDRFFADPLGAALAEGLSPEEAQGVAAMPLRDLRIAARSYEYKRKSMPSRISRLRSLLDWFRLRRR
jgi:hypothetical protein